MTFPKIFVHTTLLTKEPSLATTNDPQGLAVLPFLQSDRAGSIYEAIGLEPIINCRGTFTIIGGSVELPAVLQAMEAASGYFVQYDELAAAVGERLAAITGAEWGLIASGCAAAIKHVTIACVTGGNPEKLIRVPDLTGFEKTQVIIPITSRNAYDHAVRNVGVEVIEVATPEELEQAINPRTAMIYMATGRGSEEDQVLSLEKMAQIAAPRGIPILCDAAAENLTIPNVHLQRGATLVAYSGGKALCGPQCAGFVIGDKALLTSAWQASAPHHGPGRDDKIGKEEVMGMLAAVESWVTRDHEGEWASWLSILETISATLDGIDSVTMSVEEPQGLNNRVPRLTVRWDPAVLHITGEQVAEDFARKSPRIAIGAADGDGIASVNVTPSQMQPGNAETVATRIKDILCAERPPLSDELAATTLDLSGTWDVRVDYATSSSHHRWSLSQDGNWVSGLHETDYATLEIHGVVEGDQVKLESNMRKPGNWIPFLFGGASQGESITGMIHLGEYQTATFTAQRAASGSKGRRVTIPGGPPLAT
ncbi:MAG: aminotransferase class V-fold PLP-dependent enzyme [Gemmatimonadetes bacterium]|nr:aminotransferase class V-fold PLP-dependent enzyme [Gemmatimonadota bacterium]